MEFRKRFRQQPVTFGGQKCLLVKQISETKSSLEKRENVGRVAQSHRNTHILLIFTVVTEMRASQTGRTGKEAEDTGKYLASSSLVFATLGVSKGALKPGGSSHSSLEEQHSSVLG